MIRVLVTCVGSGVGQTIVDSLNLSREYYIVGCDSNPYVYGRTFCDKFHTVKGIYQDDYIDDVIEKAITEKINIIIPGHDYELYLFSSNIERFHQKGIEVLVSEPSLIKVSRDKKEWHDYFRPKGCNIVPTYTLSEFKNCADDFMFPAIAKPVGGSASQGISIINTKEELSEISGDDLIIQPYLFPEESDENYAQVAKMVKKGKFVQMSEISIQLIFSKQAKFQSIFISKNVLKSGVPVYVQPIKPKDFKYLDEILKFVPVLENKGVKGPVNIQGRVTDKGMFFFEMNMRFTGITGNRALFGFNELTYLINNFLDKPAELGKYSLNKVGVRQVACTTISDVNISNKDSIITILGGGSKIGQYFVESIVENTRKINLIVRNDSLNKYENLFKGYENVKVIEVDSPFLDNYLAESDGLINFVSALANTSAEKMYQAIRFVQNLIPRIAKAKIARIINVSSQSVYNQKIDIEKREQDEVLIDNPYAFQKVLIEELFESINQYNPFTKIASLRLTRVLNPADKKQCGFFGKIVSEISQGHRIHIDNPYNKTNLIHIQDVVESILFVLEKMCTFEKPEILNVGGSNFSMKEFCENVEEMVGKNKTTYGNNQLDTVSIIDSSKINDLGWRGSKTTSDIIKELCIITV